MVAVAVTAYASDTCSQDNMVKNANNNTNYVIPDGVNIRKKSTVSPGGSPNTIQHSETFRSKSVYCTSNNSQSNISSTSSNIRPRSLMMPSQTDILALVVDIQMSLLPTLKGDRFSGAQLVAWLIASQLTSTEEEAEAVGTVLIQRGAIKGINGVLFMGSHTSHYSLTTTNIGETTGQQTLQTSREEVQLDTHEKRELGKAMRVVDDETFELITTRIRTDMPTRTRRTLRKTVRQCFQGHEAVIWLISQKFARDGREAITLGNLLINKGTIAHISAAAPFMGDGAWFRILSHDSSRMFISKAPMSEPTRRKSLMSTLGDSITAGSSSLTKRASLLNGSHKHHSVSLDTLDSNTLNNKDTKRKLTKIPDIVRRATDKQKRGIKPPQPSIVRIAHPHDYEHTPVIYTEAFTLSQSNDELSSLHRCPSRQSTNSNEERVQGLNSPKARRMVNDAVNGEHDNITISYTSLKSSEDEMSCRSEQALSSRLNIASSDSLPGSFDEENGMSLSVPIVDAGVSEGGGVVSLRVKEICEKGDKKKNKRKKALSTSRPNSGQGIQERTLKLRVIEAKNLPTSSSEEDTQVYCVVRVDDGLVCNYKTRTQKKTQNPFWDQSFEIALNSASFSKCIIEVWSKQRIFKDVLLGQVNIPRLFLAQDNVAHELWFPLASESKDRENGIAHVFQLTSVNVSVFCAICQGVLLGSGNTVCKCDKCGIVSHTNCVPKTRSDCGAKGSIRAEVHFVDEMTLPLDYYSDFLDLILETNSESINKFRKFIAHMSVGDIKQTATLLMRIFEACSTPQVNQSLSFINVVSMEEINETMIYTTIFRGNSLASKFMDTWMNRIGRLYLHDVLCPVLSEILANPRASAEIDPQLMEADGNIENNLKYLSETIEKVVFQIYSSVHECPEPLRTVFQRLQTAVTERFPEESNSRYTVISSFVFLRFFNPAILSPKQFGLVDDYTDERVSRTLKLISKTVQNIANGVEFGEKEAYMKPLNRLIQLHIPFVRRYLDRIALPPEKRSHYIQRNLSFRAAEDTRKPKTFKSKKCPTCRGVTPLKPQLNLEKDVAALIRKLNTLRTTLASNDETKPSHPINGLPFATKNSATALSPLTTERNQNSGEVEGTVCTTSSHTLASAESGDCESSTSPTQGCITESDGKNKHDKLVTRYQSASVADRDLGMGVNECTTDVKEIGINAAVDNDTIDISSTENSKNVRTDMDVGSGQRRLNDLFTRPENTSNLPSTHMYTTPVNKITQTSTSSSASPPAPTIAHRSHSGLAMNIGSVKESDMKNTEPMSCSVGRGEGKRIGKGNHLNILRTNEKKGAIPERLELVLNELVHTSAVMKNQGRRRGPR
eukprot:CFRG4999T1